MDDIPKRHLALDPEVMRELGYRVVDLLVEHARTVGDKPALRRAPRSETDALLAGPPPEQGTDPAALLDLLEREVFTRIAHLDHPRFFAFIPSPANFMSVLGDALASGLNVFQGAWLESSGTSAIEVQTLDWLRTLGGWPESAGGLFLSGGSMANLTALATARQVLLGGDMADAVVYCSDQTHSSVLRALRILGFGDAQVEVLPTGDAFRLAAPRVKTAVQRDRDAGRRPFCVVANAGTTNTGAVDPLPALAALCDREGLWLHVDGAHGAAAVLSEPGRQALRGIERAHSLVIDPHKWLFQPYEIGCLLVRERQWLPETFRVLPEYLQDVAAAEEEPNFMDYGPQLTRGARALKLWLSLKTFGLEAFREAIAAGIHMAERAEAMLREAPHWEVLSPAQLGIVCFRFVAEGRPPEEQDALNKGAADALTASGYAFVATTQVSGHTALRLCTINPRTTEADVRQTLERLATAGHALARQAP